MNQTSTGPGSIRDNIINACPNYRDNIEVFNGPQYNYYEDGRDFMIRFVGLNYDVPQMEVSSGIETPLDGNMPYFNSTTFIPYDLTRIFYEPVPFDMLYTVETTPQVIINIDGVEAVCDSLNCGYNYFAPVALINSVSYDDTTLSIVGTGFTNIIESVKFSHIECTNI